MANRLNKDDVKEILGGISLLLVMGLVIALFVLCLVITVIGIVKGYI